VIFIDSAKFFTVKLLPPCHFSYNNRIFISLFCHCRFVLHRYIFWLFLFFADRVRFTSSA